MKSLRFAFAVVLSWSFFSTTGSQTRLEALTTTRDAGVSRPAPQVASRSDFSPMLSPITSPSKTVAPATTTTVVRARTATPPQPVQPSSGGNQGVVQIGMSLVGKSYVYGATGPNSFDCSGFVYYVFNKAGIHVPRLESSGYYAHYPHVSRDQLQPGDVVVYSGHIAIYIGNGQIVHASESRGGVKVAPIGAPGSPWGYARIS